MTVRYYTHRRDIHLKPGERIDFRRGHGYFRIPAAKKISARPMPPAPGIPPSMFSGNGVFTTTDTDSAHGYQAAWTAVQLDDEGDASVGNVPGILCFWQARPTLAVMEIAQREGVPYIAQAESLEELVHALATFQKCPLHVPHAIIGKVDHTWPQATRELAVSQGWDLILEWYWTNEPAYLEPNADGYPLFRNVCFGTFNSETVPGRRVYVDEQRAVWKGPYSIWDTESATGRDRVAFNA